MTNLGDIGWSSEDIKNKYEYTSSGHFFSKSTMQFFRSRLGDCRRLSPHLAAFITSEVNSENERRYTVRYAWIEKSEDGFDKVKIATCGEFHKLSLGKAKKQLASLSATSVAKELDLDPAIYCGDPRN